MTSCARVPVHAELELEPEGTNQRLEQPENYRTKKNRCFEIKNSSGKAKRSQVCKSGGLGVGREFEKPAAPVVLGIELVCLLDLAPVVRGPGPCPHGVLERRRASAEQRTVGVLSISRCVFSPVAIAGSCACSSRRGYRSRSRYS
jgi:hypothetical protein